jgi:hypothetical protein
MIITKNKEDIRLKKVGVCFTKGRPLRLLEYYEHLEREKEERRLSELKRKKRKTRRIIAHSSVLAKLQQNITSKFKADGI